MRLDDPDVVRAEYATEAGLKARSSIYVEAEGPDAREETFRSVAELEPTSVLEVGCGPGDLSERIAAQLNADVVAIDLSERMVELARARGVAAHVSDLQELPFAEASFDCVVAAWMLYHVPDVDRGLAEIARVLRPGGRLVAVTNSVEHLAEALATAGVDMHGQLAFSRENGDERLRRHFTHVERRDVDGIVTFRSHYEVRAYVASGITMARLADRVPAFDGPLHATRRVSIFVARR